MLKKTLKLETKVTGTTNAAVVYETNQPASLAPNATGGLEAVDKIVVADGILNMQFQAQDLSGTAWTLVIKQLAPLPAVELFKKEGIIGSVGYSLVVDAVAV